MNVYQKLQQSRVDLQNCNLKKSGDNKFAHYRYYELGDFLPKVNEIFLKNGLCSTILFQEIATLTIIDVDKPEDKICFEFPIVETTLKGCHEIQNIGASRTYIFRYILMYALQIAEGDALDSTKGQDDKKKSDNQPQSQTKVIESMPVQTQAKLVSTVSKTTQRVQEDKVDLPEEENDEAPFNMDEYQTENCQSESGDKEVIELSGKELVKFLTSLKVNTIELVGAKKLDKSKVAEMLQKYSVKKVLDIKNTTDALDYEKKLKAVE